MYAVDSLRQLVAKLLARAELAHFTHQEEALRPFVAVLRQCDDVAVRELTVSCVQQAVAAHPRGLGSGWRMVLQALRLGAADSNPAVMTTSLEALQVRGAAWGMCCPGSRWLQGVLPGLLTRQCLAWRLLGPAMCRRSPSSSHNHRHP
jgi:hypothetical protein